jgi:citrate synthase
MADAPSIDGFTIDPDALFVHGVDINTLTGRISFSAAVMHLVTGRLPDEAEVLAFETHQRACAYHAARNAAFLAALRAVAPSGSVPAVAAALLAGGAVPTECATKLRAAGIAADYDDGLFYLGALPVLFGIAARLRSETASTSDDIIAGVERVAVDASDRRRPWSETLFSLTTGVTLRSAAERGLFDLLMVSFHAGFGAATPTVMLPRVAAGTGAPVNMSLAAGYCGAGPSHVGACDYAMALLSGLIRDSGGSPSEAATDRAIDALLASGRKVPGFGHPLFNRDPRPPRIEELAAEYGYGSAAGDGQPVRESPESVYFKQYRMLSACMARRHNLSPNIDGVAAAILLSLGVPQGLGTPLFLISRSSAMVVHAVDSSRQPAFGGKRESLRSLVQSAVAQK